MIQCSCCLVLCVLILISYSVVSGQQLTIDKGGDKLRSCDNVYAKWKRYLTPELSVNHWKSGPGSYGFNQAFFDSKLIDKLSKYVDLCQSKFSMILIGACDGDPEHDQHIGRFYRKENWQAIFVDAVESNIEAIKPFLRQHEATKAEDRVVLMRAAATGKCETPTIRFSTPIIDPSKNLPHWYRRQVGRLTGANEVSRDDWTHVDVPCVVADDIVMAFKDKFSVDSGANKVKSE